ncbi:hemin ABC transporter ATP-binding protein, partial [Streptomyces sp. SID335]|nr:hemin ABC transporter ATP-binding protein [Streptomyces sp. SID335]
MGMIGQLGRRLFAARDRALPAPSAPGDVLAEAEGLRVRLGGRGVLGGEPGGTPGGVSLAV